MTKLASIRDNDRIGGYSRHRLDCIASGQSRPPRAQLTEEQVFRLLRCAIKDDDELVDEIIDQVYQDIVAFDYKRAESVIELIVRRSVTARWAFRALLKDMREADSSAPLPEAPAFVARPRD
jgi:hypothetical protein